MSTGLNLVRTNDKNMLKARDATKEFSNKGDNTWSAGSALKFSNFPFVWTRFLGSRTNGIDMLKSCAAKEKGLSKEAKIRCGTSPSQAYVLSTSGGSLMLGRRKNCV